MADFYNRYSFFYSRASYEIKKRKVHEMKERLVLHITTLKSNYFDRLLWVANLHLQKFIKSKINVKDLN